MNLPTLLTRVEGGSGPDRRLKLKVVGANPTGDAISALCPRSSVDRAAACYAAEARP